ncbi:MAG: hypothetical protein H6705_04445 [Myxococcales bacterium]|nr:hypothetical protein [Myxococcales bacterium]
MSDKPLAQLTDAEIKTINETIKLTDNLKRLKASMREEVLSSELTTEDDIRKLELLSNICSRLRESEERLKKELGKRATT